MCDIWVIMRIAGGKLRWCAHICPQRLNHGSEKGRDTFRRVSGAKRLSWNPGVMLPPAATHLTREELNYILILRCELNQVLQTCSPPCDRIERVQPRCRRVNQVAALRFAMRMQSANLADNMGDFVARDWIRPDMPIATRKLAMLRSTATRCESRMFQDRMGPTIRELAKSMLK